MRDAVGLQCEVCKQKNYTATRNKKQHAEKMEINKYCRFCRKHTLHKEHKLK